MNIHFDKTEAICFGFLCPFVSEKEGVNSTFIMVDFSYELIMIQ